MHYELRLWRADPLRGTRQHCVDPGDELRELCHQVAQELLGRLVADLTVVVDEAGPELNVGVFAPQLVFRDSSGG